MKKQSGQGIVEYALILAMVAGIGLCLYSSNGQGGLAESIRSVFNQTAELLVKMDAVLAELPLESEDMEQERLPGISLTQRNIKTNLISDALVRMDYSSHCYGHQ